MESDAEAGGVSSSAATARGGAAGWRPLRERLAGLSRQCLQRTRSTWLYFLPLALLSAAVACGLVFVGADSIPLGVRGKLPDYVMPIFFALCILGLLAGSVLGAYHLFSFVFESRFKASYRKTGLELENSALPLLAADEAYCSAVIEAMRDQPRNLLFAPPRNQRIEDQLALAACYQLALRREDFRLDAQRSPALRSGDAAYFNTTAAMGAAKAAGGICLILPYCNCLGFLLLPLLIVSLLRLAEQRGTLAAICDFFASED
jgi:hypothetical protein